MTEERYARQKRFAPIGDEGQKKLSAARVTLVGCGALGSHIAGHLVRAGTGFLRICDRDFVELHNLHSQVLFDQSDVDQHLPKAAAAKARLAKINPEVEVDARVGDVTWENVESLIEGASIVLDGTDNFETRFLLNDACVKAGVPWVYGGVVAGHGMLMAIRPGESACYACMLGEMPAPGSSPTCDTVGVLNTAVAVVASLQVTEAIKILTGNVDALRKGLTNIDVWTNQMQTFAIRRLDDCRACARREFVYLTSERAGASTVLCGRNAVQVTPASKVTLDLAEVERRMAPLGKTLRNEYLVRSAVEGYEITVFPDGRAIIKGTDDPAQARTVYARYVGA